MSWRIAGSNRQPPPTPDYVCHAVPTRWLNADDSLVDSLLEHLPEVRPHDTVIVSEKVAVLLTARAVPAADYPPGLVARTLVRFMRPPAGSRGLSVPEKMEYVVRTVGVPRLLLAAFASAVTRPFGVRGMFYRVAGSVSRDLDGGRPPYEHLLFPPLRPGEARRLCNDLERVLGAGVAVVDINDLGGSVRATSPNALAGDTLAAVLQGNPLGQKLTGTPFGVVRSVTPPAPAVPSAARDTRSTRAA
ncbi:hypothetical protein [Marisediminicola senii]|uniref:hypothetical protein n=1 Tax=Marisediminicola senii TaxID=2711233 RepID=UPI0019133AB1|nr:hypothetical protein [Marisediminicola senii]